MVERKGVGWKKWSGGTRLTEETGILPENFDLVISVSGMT